VCNSQIAHGRQFWIQEKTHLARIAGGSLEARFESFEITESHAQHTPAHRFGSSSDNCRTGCKRTRS